MAMMGVLGRGFMPRREGALRRARLGRAGGHASRVDATSAMINSLDGKLLSRPAVRVSASARGGMVARNHPPLVFDHLRVTVCLMQVARRSAWLE